MKKLLLVLLVLVSVTGYAQKRSEVSSKDLKEYVTFLASDSLKGRKPGTREANVAAQ